jgi:predicted nucleic acid-binding protein
LHLYTFFCTIVQKCGEALDLVVDTSIIIAVIINESEKDEIIKLTNGMSLIAPGSVHWEIGNAFSAMFKRDRISLNEAISALNSYSKIPVRYVNINIMRALEISNGFNIYAYDSYIIECALRYKSKIISLDENLKLAASKLGIEIIEV